MLILLVVLGTLILNALLACVEMAFVSVSRAEVQRLVAKKNHDAKILFDLRQNPERTLSVLQVGITLVGAVSAAVSGAGAEDGLSPLLMKVFGLSESVADSLSVGIIVIPLTFCSVVIGELVPKSLALRSPLKIALLAAKPLLIFDRLLAPVVWFLERSTKLLLRLIPEPRKGGGLLTAKPELEMATLGEAERQYVLNLASLGHKALSQVLVPWDQVVFITEDMNKEKVMQLVILSGHTRLPVLLNHGVVSGILHTKEFIATVNVESHIEWQTLIRPVLNVSSTDSVVSVLRLMQKSRQHMAVVSHIGGSLLGVVTMEDIFSEIVGEIFDEDDDGRLKRLLSANPRFAAFSNR